MAAVARSPDPGARGGGAAVGRARPRPLGERGRPRRGDAADFILVDDLEKFRVRQTWIDGVQVFDGSRVLFDWSQPATPNQFRCQAKPAEAFAVPDESRYHEVIVAIDRQIVEADVRKQALDQRIAASPSTLILAARGSEALLQAKRTEFDRLLAEQELAGLRAARAALLADRDRIAATVDLQAQTAALRQARASCDQAQAARRAYEARWRLRWRAHQLSLTPITSWTIDASAGITRRAT